jgi:hypothetical protein
LDEDVGAFMQAQKKRKLPLIDVKHVKAHDLKL